MIEKAFNFIYANLDVVIVLLVAVIAIAILLTGFLLLPSTTRISKIRRWLKYAVMQAEKEWHEGTGELKLGAVYAAFLLRFPFAAKIIPYSVFKILVDKALDEMVELCNENPNIERAIKEGLIITGVECSTDDEDNRIEQKIKEPIEVGIYIPEAENEATLTHLMDDSELLDEAPIVEEIPEEVIDITEIPEGRVAEVNEPISE